MLNAIDLTREDIYIANIEKCLPFLRWQVKIINPGIIVCLGAVAAKNIIQKDFKITKSRGIWYERGNFNIIATYHPSAILRDPNKKKEAWEDLKSIKTMHDQIISEKK